MQNADPHNSEHNAFVQDWLTHWRDEHIGTENLDAPGDRRDDYDAIETTIEVIQGTYNYKDHEAKKATGDLMTTLKVLGSILELTGTEGQIGEPLNFAYAFVNATLKNTEQNLMPKES